MTPSTPFLSLHERERINEAEVRRDVERFTKARTAGRMSVWLWVPVALSPVVALIVVGGMAI